MSDPTGIPDPITLREFVVEYPFDDAGAFLRALHPMSGLWHPDPREWIFRGHSDSEWRLVPSAARADSWKSFLSDAYNEYLLTEKQQDNIDLELGALRDFYEAADTSGLALPASHMAAADWRRVRLLEPWPPREIVPLIALAQHSGVPTRLLDWTRRSTFAAYFAAVPRRDRAPRERLAVWALSHTFVDVYGYHEEAWSDVRLASAPRSSNPNLHAQAGLFTYVNSRRMEARDRALDEIINDLAERHVVAPSGWHGAPAMLKLTLPADLGTAVLERLDLEGVNGLVLFPGFHGVVEYMKTRKVGPVLG